MVKAFVFDLDGTLIDSKLDLALAVNYALRKVGRSELSHKTIFGFIGDGLDSLVRRSLKDQDDELLKEAKSHFVRYYSEHLLDHTDLYNGVERVLNKLSKRLCVWLYTNKPKIFTDKILEGLRIKRYFDKVLTPRSQAELKPNPSLINKAMMEEGISNKDLIICGDGKNDILVAKRIDAKVIAVSYGLSTTDTLLEYAPDFICDTVEELENLLERRIL